MTLYQKEPFVMKTALALLGAALLIFAVTNMPSENHLIPCEIRETEDAAQTPTYHEETLEVLEWKCNSFTTRNESGELRTVDFDEGSRFDRGYHPRLVKVQLFRGQTLYSGLTDEPHEKIFDTY